MGPVDPSVVYIAGGRNTFASNAGAQRSLDGKVLDSGRESLRVRVNPKTLEAWFATSCHGIWKCVPPAVAAK